MASTSSVVPTHLQATLVDLIDLSLQGKQAHWNIAGEHFRSVHLQLDEIIADLRAWTDNVAERMAAIGVYPDGRAETVSSTSRVERIDGGQLATDKVIRQFEDRLQSASNRIKETLNDLEADLLSQDMVIEIATGLDKHAWMFRASAGE